MAGVLRAVLDDVATNGLSDAEVARGKGQLRGGLVLGLEDSSSRMSRIGKGELNYADHLTVEETLAGSTRSPRRTSPMLAAELLRRPVAALGRRPVRSPGRSARRTTGVIP